MTMLHLDGIDGVNMMLTYEPRGGEQIQDAVSSMHRLAVVNRDRVLMLFNGMPIEVTPTDDVAVIVADVQREWQRGSETDRNSPEYLENCRLERERDVAQRVAIEAALAVAPQMTVIDQPAWDRIVAVNQNSNSASIVAFVERWARLMEARIADGATLEQCALEMLDLADVDGNTGVVDTMAVLVLAETWIHGVKLKEFFRR